MPENEKLIMGNPGELLRKYQSGVEELSDDERQYLEAMSVPPPSYSDILHANPLSTELQNDYTQEAQAAGFGTSRYDRDYYPEEDIENTRALEQSNFAKIGSGVLKGGVTAAATAVNTTLGTIFGAGSALYELAADRNGNGRSFMDTMDAGVNNWLSNQLVKLQNYSEELFPNYRTAKERTDKYQREWWKHMGTANFIGDSLLKNFGFTVGAMAGGMAWSKLIGAGLSRQLANNVMKGAVAAAEGDAEVGNALKAAAQAIHGGEGKAAQAAVSRAREALSRGTAVAADIDKIVSNVEKAARGINKMSAKLQLYGAAVGAMGEGTVEGIMAKQEFLDDFNADMERQYAADYNNIEPSILEEGNPQFVDVLSYEQPDGSIVKRRVLTEAGQAELLRRQQEVTQQYQDLSDYANDQGDRLASTTFLLNLPILTTSNMVQFGRMLSGGWKTSRSVASGVRRGLVTGAAVEGQLPKISANYASRFGKGAVAGKTILNSLKVAGSESFEEMAQGTVSSGAKQVADYNISSFNDDGYDAEAIGSVRDWFRNMYSGGEEYLGDVRNWQEGALGAITGLFGIPGKRWNGGVAESYREASSEVKASRDAANKLNALVNSRDFQDRWHGYIRHLKYDNGMAQAISDDDEYAWHSNDDKQLINDAMMFADAGRLEDLNQIASVYGKISAADAENIREVLGKDGSGANDWAKNASDQEIVDKVKKQADRITSTVQQYKDIYDALATRAPIGTSPEFLKEMVFTAMQLKALDGRFLTMFGETMEAVEPVLLAMSAVDENGEVQTAEKSAERFKAIRDNYERIFAGTLLPIKMPSPLEKTMTDSLDMLEKLTEDDEELNKKVKDMRRLSNERKEYFKKLQTLQGDTKEKKFTESAVTQEKVDNAAEQAYAQQETEALKSLNDVKQAYFSKNAKDRADYLGTLSTIEDSNPAVKQFMNLKRRADGFNEYIAKHGVNSPDPTVTPPMIQSAVNDLIRKARSEEEFINLPDNVFSSFDEFTRDFSGIFGAPSPSTYASVKNALREAMSAYMKLDTSTASRSTISSETTSPAQPVAESTPTGYDASQPGSVVKAPNAQEAQQPEGKQEQPKQEEERRETPQVEQGQYVSETTMESLANDAVEAGKDSLPESVDGEQISIPGQKSKIAYLRTSIPEIATKEAKAARRAIKTGDRDKLKEADLSDFVEKNPEYAQIWNALAQKDAFANTALQVEVGDEIEFVVDPSFPTFDGQYQILLTTNKNDQRLVLNVLSSQTSQYYGLSDLRNAINEEYQEFRRDNPNDVFVFSKKTKVWAKRQGLIDYDFTGKEERGIINIPGYDESAPIVFINRGGEARVISGADKTAADKVSDTFNDAYSNKENRKLGNLYYLAKSDKDKYIPIRLNVEHFRESNKNAEYPIFEKIRGTLADISGIVIETNNTNIAEQNDKLKTKLSELGKYLDIHQDFFELGEYENVGVALRYSSESEKGTLRRPDQMSEEWLTSFVASLGRPVQLRQDETGSIKNIRDLIDSGIITSNARMLRPKGVDFYMNPWIAEKKEFGPVTPTQVEANASMPQNYGNVAQESEAPEVYNDDMDFGGRDDFGAFGDENTDVYGEQPAQERNSSEEPPVLDFNDDDRKIAQDYLSEIYSNGESTVANLQEQHGLTYKKAMEIVDVLSEAGLIKLETGAMGRLYNVLTEKARAAIMQNFERMPVAQLPADMKEMINQKRYTREEFDKLPDLLKKKVISCLVV